MSTPVTTPDIQAGLDAAEAALASALSGGKPAAGAPPAAPSSTPPTEPTPAPTPTPAPGVSPTMPAGLIPTPPPAPPAGSPPAPGVQPAPSFTNPAARRFVEMKGGDVEKALADGIAYSNRLAALQKAHPELFLPGGPADPNAPSASDLTGPGFVEPTAVAPETPPVAAEPTIDIAKINAETDRVATEVDPACVGYTRTWIANTEAIKATSQEIASKTSRLSYLNSLLEDKRIEIPELQAEDLKDERRTLQSEIALAEQRGLLRILHNERLNEAFTKRRAEIFNDIAAKYRGEAQEQAFTAELQQIETTEFQRLSASWPSAVTRAITDFKIPQDLAADFSAYAKQMANAAVSGPGDELADVNAFVANVAKGYVERLDRYHRAQAATYGQLAVTRAASPSPAPPAGTPVPVAPSPQTMTPEEATIDAERHLRQRLREMRGIP